MDFNRLTHENVKRKTEDNPIDFNRLTQENVKRQTEDNAMDFNRLIPKVSVRYEKRIQSIEIN